MPPHFPPMRLLRRRIDVPRRDRVEISFQTRRPGIHHESSLDTHIPRLRRRGAGSADVPPDDIANFFLAGLVTDGSVSHRPGAAVQCAMVASITFWGAVYGGVFGLMLPDAGAAWLKGIGGVVRDGRFLVCFPAADGHPAAFGWQPWPMLRSLACTRCGALGSAVAAAVDPTSSGWLSGPLGRTTPCGLTLISVYSLPR